MFSTEKTARTGGPLDSPFFAWGVIFVTGFLQFLAFPAGYLGKEHDDALYVLAAQSLAEGHYRFWFLPGRPPITTLTPGFPALLTPAAWLGGDNLAVFQVLSWLFLVAADGMVWVWARRRHSAVVAALITALFAASPLVLSRSGVVMPEAAFLAAVMAVLWMWDRGGPPWAVGAGMLACLMIRPAALPLLVAVEAAYAARGRWRDGMVSLAPPAAGLAAWWVWSRSGGGLREAQELLWSYGGAAGATWRAAGRNVVHLTDGLGASFLPPAWAVTGLAVWTGLAFLGVCLFGNVKASLAGGARNVLRSADPGLFFLLASLLMHLAWPWWYDRYWLPLLPFLYSLLAGVLRRAVRTEKRAVLALSVLLAWQFLVQGRLWLRDDPRRHRPDAEGAYAWIRAHASPADSFASHFYARDLLYTGRVFGPLPSADSAESFREALERRRQRYVLWRDGTDLGFSLGEEAAPAKGLRRLGEFLKEEGAFRSVYAEPGATIYEIKGENGR